MSVASLTPDEIESPGISQINEIFVPLTANTASPCLNGRIGVFEGLSSDKR